MALDTSRLPRHVAIIMDGNRRWAREHGLAPIMGHQHVTDHVLEPLVDRCIELGIPYLTLWAFSTENWERDQEELKGMMKLFRYGLGKKTEDLHKKGVRIKVLGELERFPKDIAELSRKWIAESANNTAITVTFALNYGGRDEITRAVNSYLNKLRKELLEHEAFPEDLRITEAIIAEHLDTAGMPDPDLIIRPGGQLRLSGFMPWQTVYSELYFTDTLMPDFAPAELDAALEDFQARQRRFGK